MKRILLVTAGVLVSAILFATGPKYYQKMGQTLPKFGECKIIDDYQNLANQFKVIANVEQSEWLPLYYEAQCYILMSFMVKNDGTQKDAYLDRAQADIKKMLELEPNNAEIYALQAFCYTGRLVVNPQERGQKYGALSAQAVEKALGIEPINPRARLIKLQNEMGTARFFGNDLTAYYAEAEALLSDWDSYEPKSRLHPCWGKGQVEGIVNSKK